MYPAAGPVYVPSFTLSEEEDLGCNGSNGSVVADDNDDSQNLRHKSFSWRLMLVQENSMMVQCIAS